MEITVLNAFKKDPYFTEVTPPLNQMSFYETFELAQEQWPKLAEMECLTALETSAHALQNREDPVLSSYLEGFLECLYRRIKKLRTAG